MNKKRKISKHVLDEMKYHDNHFNLLIETSKGDLIWQVPEEMIFIKKYLYRDKNWILLDIGCGSAENIKRNILPRMTVNDIYIGVDISKRLLERAKQHIPNGVFIQKPMSDLEFPEGYFDYVCFFGSLHHDEFPEKTLKKVSKFLKPGGFIFLREPHGTAMKKGFGCSPREGGINAADLQFWLGESNMEVKEWHYLNTLFFHLLRRVLIKVGLKNWEKFSFFWIIKVRLELILEKFLIGPFEFFKGTDMFIVTRKI